MILYYVLLGVFLGISGTLVVQEISKAISTYKDRKQAEFEAAVQHAIVQRERAARDRHPSNGDAEWNNIRLVSGGSKYTFDDPYADV